MSAKQHLRLALILVAVCTVRGTQDAAWSYTGGHGPEHWDKSAGSHCGGTRQSPIDLHTTSECGTSSDSQFHFQNFDSTHGIVWILSNNGHTAQVSLYEGSADEVVFSGGGLDGSYQVAQFHFHWGSDSSQGSEHTVDGVAYPMELHVVGFRQEYRLLDEALKHPDGLAVLAVFFKVGNDNPQIENLLSNFVAIHSAHTQVSATPFPLRSLLPSDVSKFFRYPGSLTTPNCEEAVLWTVFMDPVEISEAQLNAFRSLRDAHGHSLVNNFRPVQSPNGRITTNVGRVCR